VIALNRNLKPLLQLQQRGELARDKIAHGILRCGAPLWQTLQSDVCNPSMGNGTYSKQVRDGALIWRGRSPAQSERTRGRGGVDAGAKTGSLTKGNTGNAVLFRYSADAIALGLSLQCG
jgi:hypothetical protein